MMHRVLLYPVFAVVELSMLAAAAMCIIVDAVGSIASVNARRFSSWLLAQAMRLPDGAWFLGKDGGL